MTVEFLRGRFRGPKRGRPLHVIAKNSRDGKRWVFGLEGRRLTCSGGWYVAWVVR